MVQNERTAKNASDIFSNVLFEGTLFPTNTKTLKNGIVPFSGNTVHCTTIGWVGCDVWVSLWIFFKGQRCLKKNTKDEPPAFLDVPSFGTICNVVQCTVFPEKVHSKFVLFYFLGVSVLLMEF